jgi:Ca2+-binding EF-hand superfamily protein
MHRSPIPGHNNNRHLSAEEMDNNIGGLAVSDHKLREIFDQYDENHNGFLEFNEVKKMVKAQEHFGLVPSDMEVETMMKKFVKSVDGKVRFDEFACLWLHIAQR